MKKVTTTLLALPLLMFSGAVLAGDPAAGEAKSEACLDCHAGEDFEGMSAADIAAAIRAAIAGEIKHPPGLDEVADADVDDIAAYFYAEAGGQ
jgi:cytochrome c553